MARKVTGATAEPMCVDCHERNFDFRTGKILSHDIRLVYRAAVAEKKDGEGFYSAATMRGMLL
jgi:hypothetical protein